MKIYFILYIIIFIQISLKSEIFEKYPVIADDFGILYLLPDSSLILLDSVFNSPGDKLLNGDSNIKTEQSFPCVASFMTNFYFYDSSRKRYNSLLNGNYTISLENSHILSLKQSNSKDVSAYFSQKEKDIFEGMFPKARGFVSNEYPKMLMDSDIREPLLDNLKDFDFLFLEKDTSIIILTKNDILTYIDMMKNILKDNLVDSSYVPPLVRAPDIRIYYPVSFDKEKRSYFPHSALFTNDMKFFIYNDKHYLNKIKFDFDLFQR